MKAQRDFKPVKELDPKWICRIGNGVPPYAIFV